MNKFLFIGLHILFLTKIAQSYVLFTANIDDVKKIAKNFVSESVAEKIADFIAQVTQQIVTNVSKENEMNADNYGQLSDRENKMARNIGRQRDEKIINSEKQDVEATNKYKDENIHAYEMVIHKRPYEDSDYIKRIVKTHIEQSKLKPTATKMTYHNYKDRIDDTYQRPESQVAPFKSTPKVKSFMKQRTKALTKKKPQVINQKRSPKVKSKPTNRLDKRFDTQTVKHELYSNQTTNEGKQQFDTRVSQGVASRQVVTSTLGYAEKFLNEDLLLNPIVAGHHNSIKAIKKNQYILNPINSNEITKNQLDKLTIEEYNVKRASTDLTTEKERTDFDQYDNKYYPKAEFVATSGPVSLPRFPTEKPWWERALPDENKQNDES